MRRKYDGLKYAKKRLEDLLFEQSLLPHADAARTSVAAKEPAAKRSRSADDAAAAAADDASGGAAALRGPGGAAALVDAPELAAMRARFEASDAAREAVIKGCRDGQKLAKQVQRLRGGSRNRSF